MRDGWMDNSMDGLDGGKQRQAMNGSIVNWVVSVPLSR